MKPQAAKFDLTARRAATRRTAWIVGGIAFAIYALAIIEAVLKR
ncbi:MAG TPA: hypothetical protein VGC55_07350 [Dokdonella sp.]